MLLPPGAGLRGETSKRAAAASVEADASDDRLCGREAAPRLESATNRRMAQTSADRASSHQLRTHLLDVWRNKVDGGNLYRHLRRGGRRYRRFGARFDFIHRRTGPISGRVDIGQRPAIVEEKSRVGDWELDTMVGTQRRGVLVSMVERGSKLVRLTPSS